MRKREALYGEFVAECAKILMDAFEHSLDKPERLLPAYALINRIRLSASQAVLTEAEHLLRRIAEQSLLGQTDVSRPAPNRTVREWRSIEGLRRGLPHGVEVAASTSVVAGARRSPTGRRNASARRSTICRRNADASLTIRPAVLATLSTSKTDASKPCTSHFSIRRSKS